MFYEPEEEPEMGFLHFLEALTAVAVLSWSDPFVPAAERVHSFLASKLLLGISRSIGTAMAFATVTSEPDYSEAPVNSRAAQLLSFLVSHDSAQVSSNLAPTLQCH